MESDERARQIEYLLDREFAIRSSSKWLLTHPSPGVPIPEVAQRQRAQNGVEAEIASRRMALEALSDGELREHYQGERIRALDAELDNARKKIEQLTQENVHLRETESARKSEEPLATRARRTLLCIIGGLASGHKFDLSEPYKASEIIAKMMPEVVISPRTIGDYLKQVPEAMNSRRT